MNKYIPHEDPIMQLIEIKESDSNAKHCLDKMYKGLTPGKTLSLYVSMSHRDNLDIRNMRSKLQAVQDLVLKLCDEFGLGNHSY